MTHVGRMSMERCSMHHLTASTMPGAIPTSPHTGKSHQATKSTVEKPKRPQLTPNPDPHPKPQPSPPSPVSIQQLPSQHGAGCPHLGVGCPHFGSGVPILGLGVPILGQVSPFQGQVSPFWGWVSPSQGQVSSSRGQVSPSPPHMGAVPGFAVTAWGRD